MQIGMSPFPVPRNVNNRSVTVKAPSFESATQSSDAQQVLSMLSAAELESLNAAFAYIDEDKNRQNIPAVEVLASICEPGQSEAGGNSRYSQALLKSVALLTSFLPTYIEGGEATEAGIRLYQDLKKIALQQREQDKGASGNLISYMQKILSQEVSHRRIKSELVINTGIS